MIHKWQKNFLVFDFRKKNVYPLEDNLNDHQEKTFNPFVCYQNTFEIDCHLVF